MAQAGYKQFCPVAMAAELLCTRWTMVLGCILIKAFQEARSVIQAPERSLNMARYDLTDFEWKVIQPLLPNKPRGVPRVDDRRVLNGIFWVLRSGSPWADLPERYGPPTTIYNRFNRWRKAGVWDRLMDAVIAAHDGKVQMIDSTSVRVHQQAAAQKNRLERLVSVEVVED
jgi:transposase